MSGVKGRSGRKPDPAMQSCRAAMDEHISLSSGERSGPRVHRRCTRLLTELQGDYLYAPGNATHDHEMPLDRDNHGVDAQRYWAWMRARRS